MLLYHKSDNSTISVEHGNVMTTVHLREWRSNQQIKDARIELDKDMLDAFIEMLQRK